MSETLPPFLLNEKSVLDRFLEKISISDSRFYKGTPCWEWLTGKTYDGYGQFWSSKTCRAHRFIYEYYYGNIDSQLSLDHLCRNPSCVNPKHLEQVTIKENIRRGFGVAGNNARKTHCSKGHEFTIENTYYRKSGKKAGARICKICDLDYYDKWLSKNREYKRQYDKERNHCEVQ